MFNVKTIIVSKMTSHCTGTAQMREESERGIRKWEEMWFKTTAEDGERRGQQWCAVEDCFTDVRETLCRWQWTDEYVERPETLMRQNVVVVWIQCLLKKVLWLLVDVQCWWLNDRPTDSFVRPFVHPSFVIFWVFFISFLAVMWPWKVKVVTRIHLKLNISKKQFQLMCQWNTYRKTHTASWMVRWAWKIKVMTHNSWGLISWQQYKVQQWDRYRVLQNVFLFPSVVSVRYGWRLQRPARRCNIFPVRIHLLPPAQSVAFHEVFSGHHHLILTVSWLFA